MFEVVGFKPQHTTELYLGDRCIVHVLKVYDSMYLIYFVCIGLGWFAKEGEIEGIREQNLRRKWRGGKQQGRKIYNKF